jgi:uncharacterized protein affecting Mg2+/Co2+ transport
MVIGARAILRGKVVAIESSFDEQHSRIYTYITVKVQEVLKGQITQRKIVLKESGGQVGETISVVYGNPRFKKGERVLLYLDTWADGSLHTHQMFLGKFNIVIDPITGREMAVRSSPDENTTVLQQQLHGHGVPGRSTERQKLSAYTRMVRNRLAANWDRSVRFEGDNYASVPVLAEPPEYRSIADRADVNPQFTFYGPYRFFEPDSGQPVSVLLNPNPSTEESGVPQVSLSSADVAAAGNAWSNVTGSSLTMLYSGALNECYAGTGIPGVHVVSNNCDGQNRPSSGCAGVLALGGVWQTGFQTRTINGITFRQTLQGFVSMNPWASCYFTVNCNVQEILTHEIGHAIGLGHSQFSDATMAAFAHFDGRCASIRTDDVDGLRAIYPGTGGGPGPLTVTTSTLANGTTGSAYSQTLQASGGTSPYSWSIVSGLGNLPPGLGLNPSSGVISGTPTTTGTYNFTVRVTDSVPATAQKALSIVVTQPGIAYDSQFVSQTTPTTVTPGQTFNVNMKWVNTGTQTWSAPVFYLVSQNPAYNYNWLGGQYNAVDLGQFNVAPGQQLDFTFGAIAPTTPGTYNFQWELYKDNGTSFFGQMSTNVSVQVGSVATDNASFVSQSVAASMAKGQGYSVSVRMQNTGSTTWTSAAGYKLASQNPADNTTWGTSRVNLPASVAPGAQVTFTFNVTAPSTAGTYNFQWQMIREGTALFGAASTNVAVSVQRFSDVLPSHPYYAYIDRIAQLGVTVGCTAATYCPDDLVTRDQMAVFIERVLGAFNPPAPSGQSFVDVPPSHWAYSFIGDFATRGITVGCATGYYCPGSTVTRDQMSVFMERAVGRPNPPFPSSQRFVDVPTDYWSYAFAESFVANGLSKGIMDVIKRDCNSDGLHLCPGRPLTRAEMAAWLVIAFNL